MDRTLYLRLTIVPLHDGSVLTFAARALLCAHSAAAVTTPADMYAGICQDDKTKPTHLKRHITPRITARQHPCTAPRTYALKRTSLRAAPRTLPLCCHFALEVGKTFLLLTHRTLLHALFVRALFAA